MTTAFSPPKSLRNRHLQSICASTGPRKLLVKRKSRGLRQASKPVIIPCRDGVRLQASYAPHPEAKALAILIHGWEGGEDSTYLLSLGSTLFEQGFSVFRLNLRDHGPSHHLNQQLFNSTRLQEVLDAVTWAQQHCAHDRQFVAGFSLGGNFALRVAAAAEQAGLKIDQVAAVCPVMDPVRTMELLENGWWVYHRYFVRKWRRSLRRKLRYYPELGYDSALLEKSTLRDMNHYFVPHHTDFEEPESYLSAYAITGDRLAPLKVPCHIIMSADDPMIDAADLERLHPGPMLEVETSPWGGHCGFIMNHRLHSWVDQRILQLFLQQLQTPAR